MNKPIRPEGCNHTPSRNFVKENKEINDFLDEKEHGWFVLSRYVSDEGLSFVEAGLYTILINLSGKRGYAYPSNDFLCKELGIKKTSLKDKLSKLKNKNLIYVHLYNTQKGRRREIVTRESAANYYSYLYAGKKYSQIKKFKEEFLENISLPSPEKKRYPSPKKTTSIQDALNSSSPPDPRTNDGHAARPQGVPLYNTLYYKDSTSGVTCKREDAAFFSDLRRELGKSFSKEDVEIGLKWYEIQTDSKKKNMKKPIACIFQALKEKYAHEQIALKNAEIEKKLKIEKMKKEKREEKIKEIQINKKTASKLISTSPSLEGWTHKLHNNCIVISDSLLEVKKDEKTGLKYHLTKKGKKMWGSPSERIDFDCSHSEFMKKVRFIFDKSQWDYSDYDKPQRIAI